MAIDNNLNDALKESLRGRLEEYVADLTRGQHNNPSSHLYACMICGSGTHNSATSDGALHVSGQKWYCNACGRGGDIFSLYGYIHQLDPKSPEGFKEILEGLKKDLGVSDPVGSGRDPEKNSGGSERAALIEKYASQLVGSRGEEYLHSRGFIDKIIRGYRLGYNPKRYIRKVGKSFETIVIPYPETDYFTERLIDPTDGADKYQNQTGSAPIYMIREGENPYYFITEGQIDALSLRQSGAKNVIASKDANKIKKLLDSGFRMDGAIFVADRDPEEERSEKDGKTAGERLSEGIRSVLQERGIKCLIAFPPEGFKDSNDVLRKDPKILRNLIIQWSQELDQLPDVKKEEKKDEKESDPDAPKLRTINLREYLSEDGFQTDIEYFRKYKDRKTGFSKIDEHLTLYPGLAGFTGATSLGKTSFCVQLADQLVERGETVLYFSLEQTPIEIVTKILSRRVYARNPLSPINNVDIKNGASSPDLESVKTAFFDVSERFNIVECDFRTSADLIVDYVTRFVREKDVRPVVFVDYLQILALPEGARFDDRGRIDDAVKKLKKLSNDQELFIMMISNMARSTYREKIGEDSFKESGLIEYTCDYLFGLQLAILEDDEFFSKKGSRGGEKETLKSEKQDKIDEASEAMPKEVVFKSVKNRNGRKVFRAFFRYYPDFDLFEEDLQSGFDKSSGYHGFRRTTEKTKAPFLTV